MDGQIWVGVDVGGTSAKIGLVSRTGRVLARRRVPAGGLSSGADLADACYVAIDGLLNEGGSPPTAGPSSVTRVGRGEGSPLAGIGVSVCGYVTAGGLPELTNLPWLDGYPLLSRFRRRYGVPVSIDNDANAAALAEHRFGAGRGASRLVVVTIGTGIGLGVLLQGELVRFTGGTTGNIGHVIVDPESQERCGLGCRGCLETKATAPALEKAAVRAGLADTSPAALKTAADRGDPVALGLLAEAGRWLGAGLATFAATFSPDVIVIGGGMSKMGPAYLEAAAAAFEETGMPYAKRGVRIVPAALGNDAGLVGAVCPLLPSRKATPNP